MTTSLPHRPNTPVSRIGIIGDVHADHEHLAAAIAHLQSLNVQILLCTGDLCDGTGDLDQCVALLKEHGVHTVRGNHDRWVLQGKARHVANAHLLEQLSPSTRDYLNQLPSTIEVETTQGKLLLCHGIGKHDLQKIWPGTSRMPPEPSNTLDKIIEAGQYRWMINGHVHYRTIIHFQQMTVVNAGTLARRHRPGFSLLDLNHNHIVGFEFDPVPHCVRKHSLTPCHHTTVFNSTRDFTGNWEPVTLYA